MPHRLSEDDCTSDAVYDHPVFSATFTINGKRIYICKSFDDYLSLKKQVTVTHRIEAMDLLCPGMYFCDMVGSDGSKLTIHLSDEDVAHNIRLTETQFSVQHIPTVASIMVAFLFIEMLF